MELQIQYEVKDGEFCMFDVYTTSIKQPRFGNLSKSLPIVNMKISIPDLDSAPKL